MAFDKAQYPFVIKTLIKVGREGLDFNIIKAICDKSVANMIRNVKKLSFLPLKWGTRTSLVVLWLRLWASTAEGVGSIPGQGTKILYAMWCSLKGKKNKIK